MAQQVTIQVKAKTSDTERLIGRIQTLSEVTSAEECDPEEGAIIPGDLIVEVGSGARISDVEELLLGIDGVKVKLPE